jgi:hypothetical protein
LWENCGSTERELFGFELSVFEIMSSHKNISVPRRPITRLHSHGFCVLASIFYSGRTTLLTPQCLFWYNCFATVKLLHLLFEVLRIFGTLMEWNRRQSHDCSELFWLPRFSSRGSQNRHVTQPIFTWLEMDVTDFVYPMHSIECCILKGNCSSLIVSSLIVYLTLKLTAPEYN